MLHTKNKNSLFTTMYNNTIVLTPLDTCRNLFVFFVGNITSPLDTSHPEITNYPDSVECIWYIEVQPSFHINIRFYGRFEIETITDCTNDYLIVSITTELIISGNNDNFISSDKNI